MTMVEKLFEEKAKYTMMFVESVDAEGVKVKQSFSADLTGFGRFPSGTNMGSGTVSLTPDGKAIGEWCGMMMTKDKETIVWNGTSHGKTMGAEQRGVIVATFMTKSEKYAWMNSIIAIIDAKGTQMEFSDVAYAWE